MADVTSGEALYNKYSEVSEEDGGWLSLRDIVLSRKMPRRMLVQPLTVLQGTYIGLQHLTKPVFQTASWPVLLYFMIAKLIEKFSFFDIHDCSREQLSYETRTINSTRVW